MKEFVERQMEKAMATVYFDESLGLREQTADLAIIHRVIAELETLLYSDETIASEKHQLRGALGNLYRFANEPEQAIDYLMFNVSEAMHDHDKHREAVARIRLGEAFKYAEQHKRALEQFEWALRHNERYKDFALQHQGKCLLELGRIEEAIICFETALSIRREKDDESLIASTEAAIRYVKDGQPLRVQQLVQNDRLFGRAVDLFWKTWGEEGGRLFYEDAMTHALTDVEGIPSFYIAVKGDVIVGTYALLRNDLNSRQDLHPWLACLYVDPEMRGGALGAKLLGHALVETERRSYRSLHLTSDLHGYYEKYGWKNIGLAYNTSGESIPLFQNYTRKEGADQS
ncbi:putative acetyltransferase [Geomicrobium sp. JCM 19037]|uniref:GNAT family N-acetyltransferase n=1 Tax=Geomicrobium sp. JCM 19037 TaxID=1460634 RepID=UPI00045F1418|nr:GNAT family N-acetyltransferase [Geomicrobium sp. JCM 19037]GAK02089.1 putative acetyltransferase [Geomicrobium sp. JCM 19037]